MLTPETPPTATPGATVETNQGNTSTWNWTEIMKSWGQTAVGIAGQPQVTQPSAPAMVFQPRSNSTVWIVLLVLALVGLTIYLVKRR